MIVKMVLIGTPQNALLGRIYPLRVDTSPAQLQYSDHLEWALKVKAPQLRLENTSVIDQWSLDFQMLNVNWEGVEISEMKWDVCMEVGFAGEEDKL